MPSIQGNRAAKAYLIIERDRYGLPNIAGVRKEKPSLTGRQFAIKIVVNVPMALFESFIPEVAVDLHEGEIIAPTVELVEAADDEEQEPAE